MFDKSFSQNNLDNFELISNSRLKRHKDRFFVMLLLQFHAIVEGNLKPFPVVL